MNSTMTTYTKLRFHLERHIYKRGAHKGEAPADASKRSKSHFRVVDRGSYMAVRMYNTDLISAYPDGRVVISMGGWHTSTTKNNLNNAIRWFLPFFAYVGSKSVMSKNQLCLYGANKVFAYYDGIEISHTGEIISPLKSFVAKRIDREATKVLADGMKESGFKDMFPVLHGTCEYGMRHGLSRVHLKDVVTDSDHAELWPGIVSYFAWKRTWKTTILLDKEVAWNAMMKDIKQTMYETVPTEVYSIVR